MGTHVRERKSYVPSRRETLCKIGLGAVAATLPVSLVALAGAPYPDAELISLGEEFDRLHSAWLPVWRHWTHLDVQAREAAKEIDKEMGREWYEVYRALCETSGCNAAAAANDAANDEMAIVAGRIRAIPPRTMAGLYVKARVLLTDCFAPASYSGVADDDMDWDVLCYVQLLREIASLAGEVRA